MPSTYARVIKRVDSISNEENKVLISRLYNMFVVPVAFNKEHKNMLAYAKKLMEYGNGIIAINPKDTKLITALHTAVEKGEGTMDKESTSHDDLFDSFRLSLQFWQ